MVKYELNKFLNKYNVEIKKSFGQNFLNSQSKIDEIISSFDYSLYDCVVEIGPGLGALTCSIATKSNNLVAIESDKDMFEHISDILKDENNVRLVCSDFRDFSFSKYKIKNALIISNLPYNLTSKLIVYSCQQKPLAMGFMVQKEVGEKFIYKKDKKENNALSCFLNMIGQVSIVTYLDSSCFTPAPKVDSCFIKIDNIDKTFNKLNYLEILQVLFKEPNKTILNNLKSKLSKEVIDHNNEVLNKYLGLRARQLDIEQAKDLVKIIEKIYK